MLKRFTLENMFSFKASETLHLEAIKSCKERLDEATFPICAGDESVRVLKVVAIYGANASGKTNLLHAFQLMVSFVRGSMSGAQTNARIPVSPFLHVEKWEGTPPPSKMEVVFVIDDTQYRYGFQATGSTICEEWLYRKVLGRKYAREIELFVRYQEDGRDVIVPTPAFERADKSIAEKTRRNALFLSVAAAFAVPEATRILRDFFGGISVYSADSDALNVETSAMILENRHRDKILSFLVTTDASIDRIEIKKHEVTREFNQMVGQSVARVSVLEPEIFLKNPKGGSYSSSLPLERIVSRGTFKAFQLAGPIFDVLERGGLLVVDELDCKLHPILVRQIIRLFNSKDSNPNKAQLVFNTHDTNLLNDKVYSATRNRDENLLRRDQVYFMERDADFASHLYSLIDFAKENGRVREDSSFAKDYLNGLYGSIPYIGRFWEVADGTAQ